MGLFATTRKVRLLTGVIGTIGAVALLGSTAWWGAPFPGFFVMPNRVVASAGLPGWAGGSEGRPVYQKVLLAIDGQEVAAGRAGQERPGRHAVGDRVEYAFAGEAAPDVRRVSIRRLTAVEYLGIFGAYCLTGLAYLWLAAVAGGRAVRDAQARALTAVGWAGATFVFTAMDLYGPGTFFRLHAAAEALLLTTCVHLALTWPRPAALATPAFLRLVYGLGGMLALVEQVFLYEPRAYTVYHNLLQGLTVVPTVALAVRLALAEGTPDELRPWQRLLGGVLVGFVGPAFVFGASSLVGGDIPVSVAGWLNAVFPLACLRALRDLDGGHGVELLVGPGTSTRTDDGLAPVQAAR